MAKIFRNPQKALLLMLENIVSKYEVPTPKGGWVMAGQLNCLNIEEEEEEPGQNQYPPVRNGEAKTQKQESHG